MKLRNWLAAGAAMFAATVTTATAQDLDALADQINAALRAAGINAEIDYMEYITNADSNEQGQMVIFKDTGNKRLAFDFVPFDPRRTGLQEIQTIVDNVDTLHANSGGEGEPPVTVALGSDIQAFHDVGALWDGVQCSTIPINDLGNSGQDLGVVQNILGFGGNGAIVAADVGHYGWLPPSFFNLLAPGGGGFILGVTFTFRFIDPMSPPPFASTDIDNNGVADAAFREIYYNTNFPWTNNPNDMPGDGGIDIFSVALHEMGHGLSQAHFGSGKINTKTGKLTISPKAIMNAAHTFANREVSGTDLGGHCSNWASWPTN